VKASHERFGQLLLPDFLLVGAAKGATTSLHYYLGQHPDIFMPEVKESWFFSFVENPPEYSSPGRLTVVSDVAEYSALFADAAPAQKLGDASPSYLYTHEDAIRNIRSLYPAERLADLRIIVSLREPVSRAFSQYWTFKRFGQEPLSFEQATEDGIIARRLSDNWNIFYDYIGFGRYYEQVKAYIDAFGKERVLVVLYDDIERDPVAVCQSIFAFVGVDPAFVPKVNIKYNKLAGAPRLQWPLRLLLSTNRAKRAVASMIPKTVRQVILYCVGKLLLRREDLNPMTRRRLMQRYAPEIDRLEALIGRDLSTWRAGA
jgi:hypothetical protein